MSYDFEEASLLLNVARESLGYPQLRPLHLAAVAALEDMLPKPEVPSQPLAFDPEQVDDPRLPIEPARRRA